MNVARWIGRKIFYTESLKDRQERKLGKIDDEQAKLHSNEEQPIVRPTPDYYEDIKIDGIPLELPPSYLDVVKKTYANNKKKKRHGKK